MGPPGGLAPGRLDVTPAGDDRTARPPCPLAAAVGRTYHGGMSRLEPRSAADREALRALIVDGLDDLADGPDSRRRAEDLMRALDAYIESAPRAAHHAAEPPAATGPVEGRYGPVFWAVVGCGVAATLLAVVLLPGGVWAFSAILLIWIAAFVVLASA